MNIALHIFNFLRLLGSNKKSSNTISAMNSGSLARAKSPWICHAGGLIDNYIVHNWWKKVKNTRSESLMKKARHCLVGGSQSPKKSLKISRSSQKCINGPQSNQKYPEVPLEFRNLYQSIQKYPKVLQKYLEVPQTQKN